jgi:TonB family protein
MSPLPSGVADSAVEVKVVVKLDESGHVIDARLIEGKKKFGSILRNAALSAAKQWVFEPASLHGKSIASEHTIVFQFRH